MSGGAAVKAAAGSKGIARSARHGGHPGFDPGEGGKGESVEEDRGYAPPAPSKGLGLDCPGAAAPYFLETRAKPAGPEGPASLQKNVLDEFSRRLVTTRARDRDRMAETPPGGSGSHAKSGRVEPGPALAGRAQTLPERGPPGPDASSRQLPYPKTLPGDQPLRLSPSFRFSSSDPGPDAPRQALAYDPGRRLRAFSGFPTSGRCRT